MLESNEGATKNPEDLATSGIQYEEKQNTTQYVLDTTIRKQIQIT